jgi:hypothetical protein
MDLFRSNQRGYGLGEFQGAHFNEDKNKWIPGGVRWTWGPTTEQQWHDHLSGVRLLGQGVLCDDNRVWYACLDVDIYDIDYISEMSKIKQSGLPLVVFRTKSGGLRVVVFFNEPIEAELVIPRMKRVASLLGYAGCEIFPKQDKLDVEHGDCPSWIYVPYGGTHDMFPEQGCMTERGSLLDIADCIAEAKELRLSRQQFLELFAAEEHAKANGKANGRKHPKGAWVQEDTHEMTINTMFHDGPPCLWTLSRRKVHDMQNNFLLNVAIFFKRKYSENSEKPLEYMNYNGLQPVGDREKLNGIIKRVCKSDDPYEYTCHQEPICSHCNPHACRRMTYGVGENKTDIDYYELGLTIVNREPRIFFASIGGKRIQCSFEELWYIRKFVIKCGECGVPPPSMTQKEWEKIVRKNIEEATIVEPSRIIRSNADEYDIMAKFFEANIPNFMRMGEKKDDRVRVRIEEQRVYFKEKRLLEYCRMLPGGGNLATAMRWFINNKCDFHEQKDGYRDWWRSSYSIACNQFDEVERERWFPVED